MADQDLRTRLKALSAALVELHRALLRDAQRDYERTHGPVTPYALLQLVAYDPRFGWLRSVSEVIVEVDERVQDEVPISHGEAAAFRTLVERRLISEERDFLLRLRSALQRSTDAAMSMGAVRMALRRLPASEAEAEDRRVP